MTLFILSFEDSLIGFSILAEILSRAIPIHTRVMMMTLNFKDLREVKERGGYSWNIQNKTHKQVTDDDDDLEL